jgi:CDP-diacylglycerol--glycerol-3-phosphate 3-phosphatidyltransferase
MVERYRELPVRTGVEVSALVAVAVAALFAGRLLVPAGAVVEAVLDPFVVVGTALAWQLGYLVANLDANRTRVGTLRRSIGLANGLTLLRGGLYAAVLGFVVVPPEAGVAWVAAACYGLGVALDRVDGAVARTVGKQTDLGRRLDMAFDTFGFVAAPLVAVVWGILPVWYLALSAARYCYRAGTGLRRLRGRPVFDPPDDGLSRTLAGVQMAFLTAALVPATPAWLVRWVAPVALAASLLVFGRDYLHAAGRLPRNGGGDADGGRS